MYHVEQKQLPTRLQEEKLQIEVYPAAQLPTRYIEQLIQKSRQPHVMKYEGHEDAEGRFKDMAGYRDWAANKERIVYLLLSGDSEIRGIMWFGERDNPSAPGYDVTFGIRLYEGAVGKGLAVPFMQVTHADAARHFPNRNIWLDYAKGNDAAERTYTKFGYKRLAEEGDRIVMGSRTALTPMGSEDG